MILDDVASRFDTVLVGAADRAETVGPVIAAAGARMLAHLPHDAAASLSGIATRAVLVADLRNAAGGVAEATLDSVERHHLDTDSPIVLLLDVGDIDLASALLGHAAQLLCEPTDTELMSAVLIAGQMLAPLHDLLGESEAARLQRLNEEVARIAETLARLTKRETPAPIGAQDFRLTFDTGPSAVVIEATEIRRTIRARRLRDRQFGQGLFEDPAWDMLLDLFAAELEHGQVSVSSLCVAAAVAPTTALRWIGKLTDAGIFRRQPDPFDRRRAFIELSENASAGMRSYVGAVRAAGLPIA